MLNKGCVTNRSRTVTLLAVAALMLAGLTGCADDGDGDGDGGSGDTHSSPETGEVDNVYAFETPKNIIEDAPYLADGEVRVELPDEVLEAAPDEAQRVLVDSYTLTARDLGSPQVCAMDVVPHYVNSGQHAIKKPIIIGGELYVEDDTESKNYQKEFYPTEQERVNYRLTRDDVSLSLVDELPTDEDLLTAAPETDGAVVHLVNDYQQFTISWGCQAESTSTMATYLYFPYEEEDTDGGRFARFRTIVMADGTIVINDNEIEGFELDESGTWIQSY